MDTSILQVEFAEFNTLANQFRLHADYIDAMHAALNSAFDVVRTEWTGAGATAFASTMETTIFPASRQLVAALHMAHSVALNVGSILSSAETNAAALFEGTWSPTPSTMQLEEAAGIGVGVVNPGQTKLPGGPVFDAAGNLIRLDLSLDEFEMLTAAERIQWVEALERRMNPPGDNWFHNIQDIITFFDESPDMDYMRRGSWSSWADAGVLEAMQNGLWLHEHKGGPVPPGFNFAGGAAQQWAVFFAAHENNFGPKENLLPLWALAEQSGVNYGSAEADKRIAAPPLTPLFVGYGNLYRFVARFEDGGDAFVKGYSERYDGEIGQLVGQIAPGLMPPPFSGLPFMRHTGGALGGLVGDVSADLLIPDDLGSRIFDPHTLITDDSYTDSAHAPEREWNYLPLLGFGKGDIEIGHGPAYYLADAVENGVIGPATLPGISVDPTGTVDFYNGTKIMPSGEGRLRDGTIIGTDGWVTKADGSRLPLKGTRLNLDGSYTLSDGSRVQ